MNRKFNPTYVKQAVQAAQFDSAAVAEAIASTSVETTHIVDGPNLHYGTRFVAEAIETETKPLGPDPDLATAATSNVVLKSVIVDNTAEILWIHTPPPERRQGCATKAYKLWENALPENVHTVIVSSLPNLNSLQFWKSLDFHPAKVQLTHKRNERASFDQFDLIKRLRR